MHVERVLGRILCIGSPVITVFILIGVVTDPVNVTKLFALGGVGFSVMAVILLFGAREMWRSFKLPVIVIAVFSLSSFLSLIFSESPFVQGWYGSYGRNTGFLTYFLLSFLFLGSLLFSSKENFEKYIIGFFAAGLINVLYCLWVLLYGDFVGWNNPYGNILGLFGNPNFVSSFLGMYIVGIVAYCFGKVNKIFRFVALATVPIAFYEVVKSHAIQGLVVTFGGLAIVGFFLVRDRFSAKLQISYMTASIFMGVMAIMGALQKGPFDFIYKKSVSLRGSYWNAGLKMGTENPIFGVGMDNYGDWYRRARPPIALVDTPAIHVMSNASHNVVIDFYAFGGYPLLISYLALLGMGLFAIVKFFKRSNKYDPIFVTLAVIWICYQTQSLISINQIGLTVWGWTSTGLIIAYEKLSRRGEFTSQRQRRRNSTYEKLLAPGLVASLGVLVGLLVSWPALNSDAKFYRALNSKNASVLEESLVSKFTNPPNSMKFNQAVDLFSRSNLMVPALKYSREAVKFNSDSFDSWKQLYFLPNSTATEKAKALENMKRLDPLNPDVLSTP